MSCLHVCMFVVAHLVVFSITVVNSAYEVIFREETRSTFAKKSWEKGALVLFLSHTLQYINYILYTNYNK